MALEDGNISRTVSHTGLKFDNGHIIPDKKSRGMEENRQSIKALSLFLKITDNVIPKKLNDK